MNKDQLAALTEEERRVHRMLHPVQYAWTEAIFTALANARENYTGALQDVEHLEAEVSRLTEERDALMLAKRLTGVEHEQDHEELAQQRKDIRRLLEALGEAEHTSPCSDDSNLTPTAKRGRGLCYRCTLLAELKE